MVKHSKAPADMKYPVQDTAHKSSFAPAAEKKPPVPPSLHGPKFKNVDREHGFTGLEKDLDMDESEVEMANKMKRQELLFSAHVTMVIFLFLNTDIEKAMFR